MAVPVVASIFTSFDSFTTLPKGRTLGPGYPLSVFLIFLFSFSLIYYYGALGVFPIDSFLVFDSGYSFIK